MRYEMGQIELFLLSRGHNNVTSSRLIHLSAN